MVAVWALWLVAVSAVESHGTAFATGAGILVLMAADWALMVPPRSLLAKGYSRADSRITNFDGCTYTTDNDGNVTFKDCTSTADVRYRWRPDNRLRGYTVVNGDSVDLFYDVAGRLVRKDVDGAVERYFLWDGANMFAESAPRKITSLPSSGGHSSISVNAAPSPTTASAT